MHLSKRSPLPEVIGSLWQEKRSSSVSSAWGTGCNDWWHPWAGGECYQGLSWARPLPCSEVEGSMLAELHSLEAFLIVQVVDCALQSEGST